MGRDDDSGFVVVRGQVFSATRATTGGPTAVTRVDPTNGSEQWRTEVEATGPISVEADPTGAVVELVEEPEPGSQRRTVLDAETGDVVWPGTDDDVMVARPVEDVVLVSAGEVTSAVDRTSGEVRWTSERFLTVSDGQILASDSGALLEGAPVSEVAVLDPVTGQARWALDRPPFADVQVVGETVVLTHDRDGPQDRVTAFDLADGRERWQVDAQRVGRARVQALDDATLVISGNDGRTESEVVALDLERGTELWNATSTSVTALRIDGEPRALLGRGGAMDLVDGRTGKVLQTRSAPKLPDPDNIADGHAYVTTTGTTRGFALPGLDEAWQVSTNDEVLEGAIPGGFVTSNLSTESQRGELLGHLR